MCVATTVAPTRASLLLLFTSPVKTAVVTWANSDEPVIKATTNRKSILLSIFILVFGCKEREYSQIKYTEILTKYLLKSNGLQADGQFQTMGGQRGIEGGRVGSGPKEKPA
jgi:hypothetical protein